MGLSKKTQRTNTTSNFSNTASSTPNVPDWLLNPAKQLAGSISNLQNVDPATFAPTPSAMQQDAWKKGSELTTSPLFGDAAGMVKGINYDPGQVDTDFNVKAGQVKGESLLDGLSNYFDPYEDRVIDTTLADFDENSGKVRAQQAAQGAQNQSFRGSRFALREGETEGQLARGRAATDANIRSEGFRTAADLSGQDANRRQSAAEGNMSRGLAADTTNAGLRLSGQTTNANLRQGANSQRLQGAGLLSDIGTSAGASDRANLAMLDKMGIDRTALETALKRAPLDIQKELTGLFAGLNPSQFIGNSTTSSGTGTGTSTTQSNQSLLAWLGDMMLAGASGAGQAASSAAGGGGG